MIDIDIQLKQFQTPEAQPVDVIRNIRLELDDHDFISIIGPSGCGKTTLIRIIAGFDNDYTGSIQEKKPNSLGTTGQKDAIPSAEPKNTLLGTVGYIPQEFSLFPWLTVEENIKFGLKIKNVPKPAQDKICTDLLELVGMADFRKYYPREISGGMKQKIAICRALAINPSSNLIVMDEPFSALDAQTRNSLQKDLLNIWQKRNLRIVFVTHNIDEAVYMSNKVIVLSNKPATVQTKKKIDIPHPRDRTSVEFNQIRKDLLQFFD